MKPFWKAVKETGPTRYALYLAVGYLTATVTWILVTTALAGMFARDVVELAKIETYKGIMFMVSSSTVLYFASRHVLRRIASDAQGLLETQQRVVEAERQSIVGQLAATVAHDLANLLQVLRSNVEALKSISQLPSQAVTAIEKIETGTDRMTMIAVRLRNASRYQYQNAPQEFRFGEVVKETIAMLSAHPSLRLCTITFVCPEDVPLVGYPVLIHQLVMNLLLNAGEATGGKGQIRITAIDENGAAKLIVEDDGPGIAPSLRETIFDVFFTTKRTGSGLGLLSAKTCIDLHGGSVKVGDSQLGGAMFSILLPDLDDQRAVNDIGVPQVNKSHSIN
jgi:signal transduction histidine kinase